MIAPLVVAVVGVGLGFAATAASVAAVGRGRVELARWVAQRLRGQAGVGISAHVPREILTTAGAVTSLGILLASAALPALVGGHRPVVLAVFLLAAAVPLALLVGYILPRLAGRRWPDGILAVVAPGLRLAARVLGPILPTHLPGPRGDLAAVLREEEPDDPGEGDSLAVVSLVVGFAERTARDAMTPRTAVVAVREGAPLAEIGRAFAESGYSRLPVYRESLDDVVGMAHAFDLLRIGLDEAVPIRPVAHVPGSLPLTELLLEMQRERRHMAVVLDEYGGTAGLVTLEDVLGELVGDVAGPSDAPTAVGSPPPTLLEVEGAAPLSAVEAHFGTRLSAHGGPETVSGYLSAALGRIPRAGERIEAAGLEFDVVASGPTRLERVVIRPGPVRPVRLPGERDDA